MAHLIKLCHCFVIRHYPYGLQLEEKSKNEKGFMEVPDPLS
jgi:hypothetical protein